MTASKSPAHLSPVRQDINHVDRDKVLRDRRGLRSQHHRERSSVDRAAVPMAKSALLLRLLTTGHSAPAIHAIARPRHELHTEASAIAPVTKNVALTRALATPLAALPGVSHRRAAISEDRAHRLPPIRRRRSTAGRRVQGPGELRRCRGAGRGWRAIPIAPR